MKYETAMKAVREGKFEFVFDIHNGLNEVKYQTPSGKWKRKYIIISELPVYSMPSGTAFTGRY